MIGRLYAIALTTFREAIRQRVLVGVAIAVVAFNAFGLVLGEMSLHEEARVARDVGLTGVSLFGSITAIFLGVSLLYNEIQRRTIHTIVSKPLERWEFVIGKYLGMCITLTLLVLGFATAMAALLQAQEVSFTEPVVKALLLSYVEVLVVAAIAIFFSSFSTPFLSGMFTFGIFFIGRQTPEMRMAIEDPDFGFVGRVCELALYVVPDLNLFSVSGGAVGAGHVSIHTGIFVDWSYMATAIGYGLLYIAVSLILAVLVFSRRDFV